MTTPPNSEPPQASTFTAVINILRLAVLLFCFVYLIPKTCMVMLSTQKMLEESKRIRADTRKIMDDTDKKLKETEHLFKK
jgi:hypothetical protein